jgi:hypothetical protein
MARPGKILVWVRYTAMLIFALISVAAHADLAGAESADGLKGRLIVGYQGWFGCPGDYAGNTQWQHWFFKNTPDVDHLSVDLLPSLYQFGPNDLCDTGLRRPDGSPIRLYSA